MEIDDPRDRLVEAGADGNRLEPFRHDVVDVIGDESERVHRRDVDATIPAVAGVHDVADAIRDVSCRVRHAGRHEPDEVGFDLEVDIVRVRVVAPLAGLRRLHAFQNVVSRHLVGVPQLISRVGKSLGKPLRRRVHAVLLDDVDEGEVDVDVVVQSRRLLEGLFQERVVPGDRRVVLDHRAAVAEFRRPSERDADCLPRPPSFDLVAQHFRGERGRAVRACAFRPDRRRKAEANSADGDKRTE